ncbi:hypothetical protein KAH55_09290 [bacterium]|nr:hypothetical protein [bacterium]
MRKGAQNGMLIFFILSLLNGLPLLGQESGSVWLKTFAPGSSDLNDRSVDKVTLTFIDSLMARDNLEIIFLGGADETAWSLFGRRVPQNAGESWDEGKKMQRAGTLRDRYGKGIVGTTDTPIRGVQVIWQPKQTLFNMDSLVTHLKETDVRIDSLGHLVTALNDDVRRLPNTAPLIGNTHDSGIYFTAGNTIITDWEIKTGYLAWSAGSYYDLHCPALGVVFKRQTWAVEFMGGYTPWNEWKSDSQCGNAMLLGSFILRPQALFQLKAGLFSGWEFLNKTDEWTMKTMGMMVGPRLQWRFLDSFLGFSYSHISTMTKEVWHYGMLLGINYNFTLN